MTMNPNLILSTIVTFMNDLPLLIQKGLDMRLDAAKTCPLDRGWVELSLLQGHCRHCGSPRFFMFQQPGQQYLAVQCTDCHWTLELPPDRWWGQLGRYLLTHANALPLGTVRQKRPLIKA